MRGVFRTFSREYDARAVKLPLAAAQELLGTPGANAIVIMLEHTGDTAQVQAALEQALAGSGLEVKNWVELNDFYDKVVHFYDNQFSVLRFIILIMVLLSVVTG